MFRVKRTSSKLIDKFVAAWPGEKYFGIYRFLPIFFLIGAALEFSMVNFRFKEANFYRVYTERRVKEAAEEIYLKKKYGIKE